MITPVSFASMQPNLDQPPAGMAHGQSATLGQAEGVINQAKATLAAQKKETLTLSADPRVTQWHDFNCNSYLQIMEALGLPNTMAEARDQHPEKATRILKHIEQCENELGSLSIDIRRKTIQPFKAVSQAQTIVTECANYQNTVKNWREQITLLIEADKTLRAHLSLAGLLPLTKELNSRTAPMVTEGYDFYRMVKDKNDKSDTPSLHSYHLQAIDLEKRIRHIDLNSLPGLARTIVDHNLQTAIAATDQLKEFIEFFLKNLPGECKAIDTLQQELIDLREKPARAILERIEPITASLAKNLIGLRNKAQSLKQIQFLPIVLEETRTLHYTIKNTILPEMKRRISEPGSPVNPNTVAAEKTADFFMGMKGFVRAIKLLFSAAGGQKTVKSEDLHHILIDLLNTCDIYYGNTKADISRLHNFIEAKLSDFERPFPYEGLFLAAKETISTYGSRVEKMLYSFETTDFSTDDTDEKPSQAHKTTVGRLIAKLEVRTANLESARV
ncbi:hypothetical protein [Thiovibrio frasassiensis]|uniref:Uncharacterized protein n=1 Tax=Thiovibrio frasassiensis TaxID=2984131 RepID=A0A9X4MIE5_9BACT|nr:hypothetical protein [Thiovibrio frasassiensis]MDG4476113.1 hypothetical protein [Thiovibrio frasassiensis]